MSRTWEALRPFADLYLAMHAMIHHAVATMTDADRAALLAEVESATSANCGWHVYAAAQIIREAMEAQKEIR